MMRLFTALELPAAARERIVRLQAGLPGARWVKPENLHLTLRFIGEVDDPVAGDLDDALSKVTAPAFALQLDGIDWFGDKRKPRQLVLKALPAPALVHLQAKVDRAVVGAGLPADNRRRFVPHVTLARFNARPGDRLLRWLGENSLLGFDPIPVDRFVLYQSHLGHGGPIYHALADYPLRGLADGAAVMG